MESTDVPKNELHRVDKPEKSRNLPSVTTVHWSNGKRSAMSQMRNGFDTALAASFLSNAPRQSLRLGAALFAGARLLSVGCNLYGRSHPASNNGKEFVRSTHAEHQCLLRRQWNPIGNLTLFVARRLASGTLGCSRPCANCMALARLAGVRRVFFYNHEGKPEEVLL